MSKVQLPQTSTNSSSSNDAHHQKEEDVVVLENSITNSSNGGINDDDDDHCNNIHHNDDDNIDVENDSENIDDEKKKENIGKEAKTKKRKKPLKFDEYYVPDRVLQKKGIDLAFVCDATLGRLAKHIRMLGGNCFYDSSMTTNYMLYIARTQNRIILTKNRTLINQLGYQRKAMDLRNQKKKEMKKNRKPSTKETVVSEDHEREMKELELIYKEQGLEFNREDFEEFEEYSSEEEDEEEEETTEEFDYIYYFVKSRSSKEMINETVKFFKIEFEEDRIFTICIQCNHHIVSIDKESIKDEVFPSVYKTYNNFFRCSGCNKIYWGKDKTSEHVNYKSAKSFAKEFSYNPEDETSCE
ncbi:Hypothetical protein NAEGRDRAFT_59120 [Naegleria gruberi]|uniref:Mut7-C RNAse domain-containing protein n=1 Tax=Naegleria gruberi TaxID=5762 RepID=D2VSQ2_NAEGR|nr:uncharacterized protein NAEGRDRAFT_59120 [Naegleria gruberi]EFC40231.1 Hypothetical protein NAEGRDRAFT_59120 [Naegleria gruberi]|eukprot:XP_002672975.1 Hypothetical protein NAEGRDRAFT_59120 [Naegleria gruberi strain NEG-M]